MAAHREGGAFDGTKGRRILLAVGKDRRRQWRFDVGRVLPQKINRGKHVAQRRVLQLLRRDELHAVFDFLRRLAMNAHETFDVVEDRALFARLLPPRVAVIGHQRLRAGVVHLRLVCVEAVVARRRHHQLAGDFVLARFRKNGAQVANAFARKDDAGDPADEVAQVPRVAELLDVCRAGCAVEICAVCGDGRDHEGEADKEMAKRFHSPEERLRSG